MNNDLSLLWATLGGEIKHNRVAGASNFSDSTSLHKFTVPTGRRWYFIVGSVNRDASQGLTIDMKDDSDDQVIRLCVKSAATGVSTYPSHDDSTMKINPVVVPMKAGWYINVAFSGAQGAGAWITALVLEVPA